MNLRNMSLVMLVAVVMALLLSGCLVPANTPTPAVAPTATPAPATATAAPPPSTPRPQPASEQDCVQQGGIWGPQGKAGLEVCNLPTSDSGNSCTDVSQCEGTCLANADPAATVGQCSPYTLNFGCYDIMQGGEWLTLCVD